MSLRNADAAVVRRLDVVAASWVLLWLLVGVAAGWAVWQLSEVGDAITSSGRALDSAGEAVRSLGDVPLIGQVPAELGDRIVGTADDIVARGEGVKTRFRQLAVLLGLLVLVVPTAPVLGLYLPLRLARAREVAAIRRALAEPGGDRAVERYLAERALHTLPYATIASITADPRREIEAGRTAALADAQLARLGLRR